MKKEKATDWREAVKLFLSVDKMIAWIKKKKNQEILLVKSLSGVHPCDPMGL